MNKKLIFYKVTVHWPGPEGIFVIAGNNQDKKVFYFLDSNLHIPIACLDLNDGEAQFPQLVDFNFRAIATATCRLREAMINDNFSSLICHVNCAVYVVLERIIPVPDMGIRI